MIPTAAVWLMAAVGFGIWVISHLSHRAGTEGGSGRPIFLRFVFAAFCIWSVFQAVARRVELATPLPLWCLALAGALGLESCLFLYQRERRMTRPRIGYSMLVLRLFLFLLLLLLLAQPVVVSAVRRKIERQVVVLLDDSASMHFTDRNLTPSERLALAELFGFEKARSRPHLDHLFTDLQRWQRELSAESQRIAALTVVEDRGSGKTPETAGSSAQRLLDAIVRQATEHASALSRLAGDVERLDEKTRKNLLGLQAMLRDGVLPRDGQGPTPRPQVTLSQLQDRLRTVLDRIGRALEYLPAVSTGLDESFFGSLSAEEQSQVNAIALKTRAQAAEQVLTRQNDPGETSLLERLKRTYRFRLIRFGKGQVEDGLEEWIRRPASTNVVAGSGAPSARRADLWLREGTDIAGALEYVLDRVPTEELAGVILLSDGQHNAESGVESAAARLGALAVPVRAVVLGGREPPPDASILNVRAPDSLYVGDKLVVRADLKFDGLRGRSVKVRLYQGEVVVQEETVQVSESAWRTSLRLAHKPEGRGTLAYRLEIEPQEGETFMENNTWRFEVGVTDDRTNVLLVEDRPRWEFRYLRNLFYGRDKSVHLQFVLIHPDRVEGAPTGAVVRASAARKFGDAEANALPDSVEEWRMFDVIILGDLPPETLSEDALAVVRDCVAERGALLVVIAGPNYMPHVWKSPILKELLPILYEEQMQPLTKGPEEKYRLRLTPDGRNHVAMQLSASAAETEDIWAKVPDLYWRHPIADSKDSATILAFAEPVGERSDVLDALARGKSPSELSSLLDEHLRLRRKNALILFHQYGHGKVLMLNFDLTWRLRYGVGDLYHHRFWGQVLRWGAGESLRSGTEFVRLGTDRLTYLPDERVKIIARVLSPEYKPLPKARVWVDITREGGETMRRQLEYRRDSNGIFEALLDPYPVAGRYRVVLGGEGLSPFVHTDDTNRVETIETEFTVAPTRSPVELAELTADPGLLTKIATMTGGSVVGLASGYDELLRFGEGSRVVEERREIQLWNSWPLFLLIVGAVTSEWILRKRGGLP